MRISAASGRQFRNAMAFGTGVSLIDHMLVMLTGIPAVVLRSAPRMTGGTLRVDIERTGRPVGCGLTAVTADVGAGAAAEAWRTTALIIEAGQNADFGAAIIMGSAIMTGRAARAGRTEAQHSMFGVSTVTVRAAAAVRRLTVTGGAVRVRALFVAVTGDTAAAVRRDTRLQGRNGGVAEVTIVTMGDLNRRNIVTVGTRVSQGH